MQSRHFLICVFMLLSICSYGQQWGNIGVSPQASPGHAITVRGFEDSLRLKMLNVCETGILMAFTDSIGGSFVAAPLADYSSALNIIEVLPDDTINGLAGTYGSSFQLLYSTSDSIYFGGYVYNSSGNPYKHSDLRKKLDSTLTLFGSEFESYALVRIADSSALYKIVVNTGIQITDTVPLEIQTLTGLFGGNVAPEMFSLVGTDRNEAYHSYEINTYTGQVQHWSFGTLPGTPVFAQGVRVISSDSNGTYLSTYHKPDSNTTTFLFQSPRLILQDVEHWNNGNTDLAILARVNDTAAPSIKSRMLFLDTGSWRPVDSMDLEVEGRRLYSSFHNLYERRYFQYIDSAQNLRLEEVDESMNHQYNGLSIPSSPILDRAVVVCFIGIDGNDPPPIQTTVYPNPTRDQCHAEIKNVPCDRNHYLELFDMNGRKVYEATFQSKCTVTIPVKGLQAGVYLLKMEIAGRSYTHKIIKQ